MHIILTSKDLASMTPRTQAEIERFTLRNMFRKTDPSPFVEREDLPPEFGMGDDVKDLTLDMIRDFFAVSVSERTTLGLRLIAEEAVPYIDVQKLIDAGITNIGHFQSRITVRTRTITGDPGAYMLTWDDWEYSEDGSVARGRYAVSPLTHKSLRRYFNIN